MGRLDNKVAVITGVTSEIGGLPFEWTRPVETVSLKKTLYHAKGTVHVIPTPANVFTGKTQDTKTTRSVRAQEFCARLAEAGKVYCRYRRAHGYRREADIRADLVGRMEPKML